MAIDLSNYRITILCEDIAQYDFIYAYIGLLGAKNKRKITQLNTNNNASVLRHYPSAVKSYRQRCQENVVLIVMIDADEKTIQERLREFDEKLDFEKYKLNQATRFDDERILLFVPIRNIESWFHYVATNAIDVETVTDSNGKIANYKGLYLGSKKKDVAEFAEKMKSALTAYPKTPPHLYITLAPS